MLNYARNKDSDEIVFFNGAAPTRCTTIGRWAFWRVPEGTDPSRFGGQLIGESPDVRCARLRHAPKERQCNACREAHHASQT